LKRGRKKKREQKRSRLNRGSEEQKSGCCESGGLRKHGLPWALGFLEKRRWTRLRRGVTKDGKEKGRLAGEEGKGPG